VIIVGAGAAGMAAAIQLAQADVPTVVLEARDRIGGRIFTQVDPVCGVPVELGAEFIHGFAPEIWEPLQSSAATITEVEGQSWCVEGGNLTKCDLFSRVDSILESMDDSLPDGSFLAYLDRKFPNSSHDPKLEQAKRRAIQYVSGFNAADPGLVGVHWLSAGIRAEQKRQGHRAFRSGNGYADLVNWFQRQISQLNVRIQMETAVDNISWKRGCVKLTARGKNGPSSFRASQVLITLPISLLKTSRTSGSVEFTPSLPAEKIECLDKLEMGKVIRITLRFRHRFWEAISGQASESKKKTLSDMSFLFSENETFPTWWTRMPHREPLITGWAPFRAAEFLSHRQPSFMTSRALMTLSELLGVSVRSLEGELEAAYVHDWQADPFSLGAYSYGKVGADGAQEELARPIENTLFFAGEATDTSGNNGTVHGAIASGHRAAAQIIKTLL